MAHVDLNGRQFDNLTLLENWRPQHGRAMFAFFIVSNSPDVWESEGPAVRRPIHLLTTYDLGQPVVRLGWEQWKWMWRMSLKPGESIAVGTHAMPGERWVDIQCAAAEITAVHVWEPRTA